MQIYRDKEDTIFYRVFPVKSLMSSTMIYEVTMRGDWFVVDVETSKLTIMKPADLEEHFNVEWQKEIADARKAGEAKGRLKLLSLLAKLDNLIKEYGK